MQYAIRSFGQLIRQFTPLSLETSLREYVENLFSNYLYRIFSYINLHESFAGTFTANRSLYGRTM